MQISFSSPFVIVLALTTTLLASHASAAEADALYWVFLNRGNNKTPLATEEAARLQAAHIGNLGKLGEQGRALTAGPLGDNGSIRGIVVLTVTTPEEVKDCFTEDPFVQQDYLQVEAYRWLADRKQIHPADTPFKIAEYTLGLVKKGPHWRPEKGGIKPNTLDKLLPSLRQLTASHLLAVSGPLLESEEVVGILLFRTSDQTKLRPKLDRDAAVKSGRVVVELHSQWLGQGVFGPEH